MNANPQPAQDQSLLRQTLAGTRFVKITGPVGDWIVFSDPHDVLELTEAQIVTLCDRTAGVGATGVVVVQPAQHNPSGTSPQHRITAWQSDGHPASNMTEPARIATCVLAVLKNIPSDETSHHVFETDFGPVTTVYTPSYIGVDIGQWEFVDSATADAAGSDAFVMAAGLTDPRPGLSIHVQNHHVTVAVETLEELEAIDLQQQPSLEPSANAPTSINFVIPQDPLMADSMGQLRLRNYTGKQHGQDLASATAAATVALQTWTGLQQLTVWNVATQYGDIVVQIHDENRLSTFAKLSTVFFGKL